MDPDRILELANQAISQGTDLEQVNEAIARNTEFSNLRELQNAVVQGQAQRPAPADAGPAAPVAPVSEPQQQQDEPGGILGGITKLLRGGERLTRGIRAGIGQVTPGGGAAAQGIVDRLQGRQSDEAAALTLGGQGATLGFGDEIRGLLAGAVPGGRTRAEAREEARREVDAAREQLGPTAFAPEVLGAAGAQVAAGALASQVLPVGSLIRAFGVGRPATGVESSIFRSGKDVAKAIGIGGLGAAEAVAFSLGQERDIPVENRFQIEMLKERGPEALLGFIMAGGTDLLLRPVARRIITARRASRGAETGRELAEEALGTTEEQARQIGRDLDRDRVVRELRGEAQADEAVEASIQRKGPRTLDTDAALERLSRYGRQQLRDLSLNRPQIVQNIAESVSRAAQGGNFPTKAIDEAVEVLGTADRTTAEALFEAEDILQKAARRVDTPEGWQALNRFRQLNDGAFPGYRNRARSLNILEGSLKDGISRGRGDFGKSSDAILETMKNLPEAQRGAYRIGILSRVYEDIASTGKLTRDTFDKLEDLGLTSDKMLEPLLGTKTRVRQMKQAVREGKDAVIAREDLAASRQFWTGMLVRLLAAREVLRFISDPSPGAVIEVIQE